MTLNLTWYILIGMSIIGMFIYDYINTKHNLLYSIIVKGTCSTLFVLAGFASRTFTGNLGFSNLILCGLIFGAVADVVLDLSSFKFAKKHSLKVFMFGACLFLVGHIFYTCALLKQNTAATRNALIIAAVIAIIILPLVCRKLNVSPLMKLAAAIYLSAVILVLGSAVSVLFASDFAAVYIVFTIAAASFLISDIVLTLSIYGEKSPKASGSIVLYTYYCAQLLIACSQILM